MQLRNSRRNGVWPTTPSDNLRFVDSYNNLLRGTKLVKVDIL